MRKWPAGKMASDEGWSRAAVFPDELTAGITRSGIDGSSGVTGYTFLVTIA